MLQQIKQSILTQVGENPQFSSTLLGKKNKQHSKKKKEFKIKKGKLNDRKKNNKEEGFTNPIYAGLDTEDMENDNRLNFGPWIHEGMNMQSLQQRNNNIQNRNYSNFQTDRRYSYQTQNIYQNMEKYDNQSSSRYNRTSTQDLRMLQTKSKRQFQQLRCSSLMLQISRNVTLSPIKPLKIKQNQLNKNNKSKSSSIQLLKYNSMKYLFSNSEKNIDSNVFLKRPNAVIYNYCCSTVDNNLFGGDIDNLLLNRKTNNTPLNELKQQFRQKSFKNTLRQTQTLLPIKKSISRQLYDELIKKKSKLK